MEQRESRVFVTSAKSWSYVEFTDPNHDLPNQYVGVFESLADTLLDKIQPRAHVCHVNTSTPTVLEAPVLLRVRTFVSKGQVRAIGGIAAQSFTNQLIPAGSFVTKSGADSTDVAKVVSVHAPVVAMKVTDGPKKYTVHLRLLQGLTFRDRPPAEQLTLRLVVVRSDYSKCGR